MHASYQNDGKTHCTGYKVWADMRFNDLSLELRARRHTDTDIDEAASDVSFCVAGHQIIAVGTERSRSLSQPIS